MANSDITRQKAGIRTALKQARAAVSDGDRRTYSALICRKTLALTEVIQASTVFIYISLNNEVHTHDLINELLQRGKNLCVPRIMKHEYMIAVPFTHWEETSPGELGILTPVGDKNYTGVIDVAIMPGLGFTPRGHRIGFGRGYYDKWLAENPVPHKVALAFEVQLVDSLPNEVTDIPVDKIITEQRVIETNISQVRE